MLKDLLDRAKRVAEEHLPEDVLEAGRKLGRSVAAHAPAPLAEVIHYVTEESEQAKAEAEQGDAPAKAKAEAEQGDASAKAKTEGSAPSEATSGARSSKGFRSSGTLSQPPRVTSAAQTAIATTPGARRTSAARKAPAAAARNGYAGRMYQGKRFETKAKNTTTPARMQSEARQPRASSSVAMNWRIWRHR